MVVAYVINLDSRPDRWEQIQKDWKNTFPLVRTSAVQASPGWKGCSLSHIKVVEEAKSRGEPYVLVWEDDCIPRKRHPLAIQAMWNEVMTKLASNQDKWDVVLGGATWSAAGQPPTLDTELSGQNAKVYNLPKGFCTHWTLWNVNTTYDKLMTYKTTLETEIDVFMYTHFRVKIVLPFLAEQRQGFSNIVGSDVNYSALFDYAESMYLPPAQTVSELLRRAPHIQKPSFITK